MKFLIDECLSPALAKVAKDKGHGETSHVVWMGLAGRKDWELTPIILGGDWTFVTKNSVDFRGPKDTPGSKGQYADVAIHAGLICLNGPPGMDLDMQIELFGQRSRSWRSRRTWSTRCWRFRSRMTTSYACFATHCHRSRGKGA